MSAKWGSCVVLAVLLALSAGCRTPQPKLKPEKIEDNKLVDPPREARFETTGYPKQAFDSPVDSGKAAMDSKLPGNSPGMQRGPTSGGLGGAR